MNQSMAGGSTERSSLHATTGRIAAVGTALLLVLFLVLSVSRAAFTASTENPDNSITAGVVTLTDNDAGVALFNASDVTPSTTFEECIRVEYAGAFTSGAVMMYATPVAPATEIGDLDDFLNVEIDRIDTSAVPMLDDATHDCTAFNTLALVPGTAENIYSDTLGNFPVDHANGVESMPGEEGIYSFRVTITVADNPSAAGAAADWNFVWETKSA